MNSLALVDKLAIAWPPGQWSDVTVLLAVSGGADSVALCRALHGLHRPGGGRLLIAHFNHGTRGAASDADQAFVEQLGRMHGLTVLVESRLDRSQSADSSHSSALAPASEESLRQARYAFLSRTADEQGARYVATAHTADDQAETVLHNVLRGTGLTGLAGIPRVRRLTAGASLIRPLLEVTRTEVLDYLQALGQGYCEDVTNDSLDYTRNRIRHALLPLLERDYQPHVRRALLRLSRMAAEADAEIGCLAEKLATPLLRPVAAGVELRVRPLLEVSDYLGREVLITAWTSQGWPQGEMTFEKWQQLLEFARAPHADALVHAGPMFPGGIRAEREGGVLRLSRKTT